MAQRRICLALQGGGSHGAYTWGVLDGLLAEESLEIPQVPTDARAILDRLNEVAFNAALIQEIEAIDAVNELKAGGKGAAPEYKRIRLHEIKDEPGLARLGHASKGNTDWKFLLELRDLGRRAAKRWLRTSFADVGRKTTADMHRLLRCLASS